MNKNHNNARRATCELGDYFSRLGGSARPYNMAESEIYLYIICMILELNDKTFVAEQYLNNAFLDSAAPVIEKTHSYLSKVSLSFDDLIPFVISFYKYADTRLNDFDKTRRWEDLGEYLRARST